MKRRLNVVEEKKGYAFKCVRFYALRLLRMRVDELRIYVSVGCTSRWIKGLLIEAGLTESDYEYGYHRNTEEEKGHWHLFKREP